MRLHVVLFLTLLPVIGARGQLLMEGKGEPVHLLPSDAAVLEGHERRADLRCTVHSIKPELGFDFAFHSGYSVTIPLRDIGTGGGDLKAVFRVIPEGQRETPAYFLQKWTIPHIEENAKGTAELRGGFVTGAGKYKVEWLLRDPNERVCSSKWEVSAESRSKDKDIQMRLLPGTAVAGTTDLFGNEAPVKRATERSCNVVVLLHVAPQDSGAAELRPAEELALLSILRSIARESRITSYSIVAFNLDQGDVLYRRDNATQLDFPELGEAIHHARLGTVDVRKLGGKDREERFLNQLLEQVTVNNRPDALIFVGAKTMGEAAALRGGLKEAEQPHFPVFYLKYDGDPALSPWRDLIGAVVRCWKGIEYTITKPRDLFMAWNEVMSRISPQTTEAPRNTSVTNSLRPK
jgi:hypothetical protein